MNVQEQIKAYIIRQPEPKLSEMQALHRHIIQALPHCRLWFTDGKNSEGKTVTNPNIGYGFYTIKYADGTTKVSVTIYNESLERMEKMIEMGFKEGFGMTLKSLEELLATL